MMVMRPRYRTTLVCSVSASNTPKRALYVSKYAFGTQDVRHAISAFGVNGVTDPGGVYPKDLDTMVATAVSPDRYSSSDMFMDQVQLGTDRLMGPG